MEQLPPYLIDGRLPLEELELKTKDGSLRLSAQTAGLLGEVMTILEADDPDFAIQAALKTWIWYCPTTKAEGRLIAGNCLVGVPPQ